MKMELGTRATTLEDPLVNISLLCAEDLMKPFLDFQRQREQTVFSVRLDEFGGQILDERFMLSQVEKHALIQNLMMQIGNEVHLLSNQPAENSERLAPAVHMRIAATIFVFATLSDIKLRELT
jgi:hypothetical protein